MANFESPNPVIPFADSPFYIPQTLEPWQSDGGPRIAGVSSFGMGGTNAHAVLEEPPLRPTSDSIPDDSLLLVSARTAGALEAATTRLADWLSSHPEASLADVAFTLQVGRRRFPHRRFVVCRSVEEGVAALRQPLAKPVVSRIDEACERTIAFMFPAGVRNTSGWHAAYTNGNLSSAIASIAVRLCSRTSSVATSARFSSGVRGHTRVGGTRACPNSVDAALPLRN